MQTVQIIAPTTAAATTGTINAQTAVQTFDAGNYPSITVCADALDTAETVGIYILCGNTFNAMTDSAGNVQKLVGGGAGTAIPALQLVGGNVYGFSKTATAAVCGVYVNIIGRYS
jgi:hypothetical protein